MTHTVVMELAIPREAMEQEIDPKINRAFGLIDDAPVGLALIQLSGARYGGQWNVKAVAKIDRNGTSAVVGEIWCPEGTPIEEVLGVADEWIRSSEKTNWVPGVAIGAPVEATGPYFVHGMTLVRANV